MEVESLGYRTDLMIRRLAGAEVTDRSEYLVVRTLGNPDFWWGNFLLRPSPPAGDGIAHWVETFRREFPHAGHVALGVDGVEGQAGEPGELDVEVDVVLSTSRQITLPASRQVAEARALTTDQDWAQLLRQRIAGLTESPSPERLRFLERSLQEYRRLAEQGHGTWYAVFVDGDLAASAGLFGDGRGLQRFQSVETHPAYRRRGLATALIHQLGEHGLCEVGADQLVIVADPAEPAIDLYRALGFADTEQQVRLSSPPKRD